MIEDLLLGLGFVALVEGLILALAPGRIETLTEAARALGPDRLRQVGLAFVAAGVGLVWLARG
jgi:uncharacterized protein YjeT (DUF2065 family)